MLSTLEPIGFLGLLWIYVLAKALHELEEWNIVRWYQRHYADLPPMTERSARTWLVFTSLYTAGWCAVATLPGKPALAAFLFLPAIALDLQNALQHLYWLLAFRAYAPGVVTSSVLLLPLGGIVVAWALQRGHVPVWYVIVWGVLMLPGLVQTVRAGNRLTPQFRAIHRFSFKVSERLAALR